MPTSRRYAAIAVFMTALVGVTVTANAQRRDLRTPSDLGKFTVPLRAFPGIGDNRFLSPDIPVRQWNAPPVGRDPQKKPSRVQIGGPNGSNVQEKVVDATFQETNDEVTPYWTDDEQVVYFAGNSGTGASSHYQLYRLSASVANNPQQTGSGQSVPLTNETLADHKWPTPDRSGGRIAFIKSVDNRSQTDPLKAWHLYIAVTPSPGSLIDTVPGGNSNLLNLTGDIARFRGKPFTNIGRAAWLATTDLVFSGLLEGDIAYHLYTVNVVSRKFTQLTSGSADERNPAVSPDSSLLAFDSTAAPKTTGDIYVGGTLPRTDTIDGDPAVPTGVNASKKRNVFVMSLSTNNVSFPYGTTRQFTNRYAGAPDSDDIQPAFSSLRTNPFTNQGGANSYIAFASTRQPDVPGAPTAYTAGSSTHDIYSVRVNSNATQPTVTFVVEGAPTSGLQSAKQIDSNDPGYIFDDQYPTWSPFINTTRVGFQSNRIGDLQTNNFGSGFRNPNPPTPSNYNDILLATVVDVTAPMLIRYDTSTSTGEVLHINQVLPSDTRQQPFDPNNTVRVRESGVFPGQNYFFTVRVEDREAGIQSVWLQFKNPNSRYQSIAQGGGGVEHKEYDRTRTHSAWLSTTDQPQWRATDGNEFVGNEFEAQVIGMNGVTYFNHTGNNTTGVYPAGDTSFDGVAFSGSQNPPLDGQGGRVNAWLKLSPIVDEATGLPIKPADGRGGVLYGAKWKIPNEASDWYIDVIAYDNATNPFRTGTGTSNWIIYDNVWGFSSALPLNPADYDVLFVSDYTLGQKFFASRPGSRVGAPDNDQPLRFGAESYYTDPDMTRYPSEWNIDRQFASGRQAPPAPGSTDPRFWSIIGPSLITNGSATASGAPRYAGNVAVNPGVMHPLGVGSYRDEFINFTPVGPEANNETYALPNTGRYTIWRTLSRGAIPQEILDAYLPYNSPAPADVVVNESAERSAKVNKRVIVWAAPFIGNIFVGAGTLADLKAQERLTNFVNAGGSLFVSGMDIGFALAGNGQSNTFFTNTLNAQFGGDSGGASSLFVTAAGSTVFNTDAWAPRLAYGRFDGTFWVYSPPTQIPISSFGGTGNERRDGSFISATGPGRYIDSIARPGVVSRIEQTFDGGNVAAIRNDLASGGTVYYAAYGLESIGNEWYTFSRTVGSVTRTMLTNQGRRAQLMTNFILSVRTGFIAGRIIDDNGSPVADALIRATQGAGKAIGTALSDASGNFVIQGLKPGAYGLDGYKAGFYTQHSVGYVVQAANTTIVSIKLKRANPGQLSNIRKPTTPLQEGGVFALDGKTGLGGVQVQARRINADGTLNVSAAVTSDGTDGRRPGSYLIADLLIWDLGYEVLVNPATNPEVSAAGRPLFNPDGTARTVPNPAYRPELSSILLGKQPQVNVILGTGTLVVDVAVGGAPSIWRLRVVEDQVSQMDFLIGGAAQRVVGTVLDVTNDQPINGAFVTAVDESTGATIATGTSDAAGSYTLMTIAVPGQPSTDKLPAASYKITASALGYNTVTFNNIVVGGTTTLTLPVFRLTPLPPGSVSGTVRKVTGNALEGGVTIKFFIVQNGIAGTTPVATAVTSSTLTTGSAGYTFNYQVPSLSQGEYQVIAEKPGLTSDPSPLPNLTVASAAETKNYNFRMQPAKVYADGIQLISTPGRYDYTSITSRGIFGLTSGGDNDGDGIPGTTNDQAVFNQFNIADWTGTDYNIASDIPIQVGKGYFVNFRSVVSVTQVGAALPGDTFTITLAPGWNLIGHPFVNPASTSNPAPDLDINVFGEVQEGSAAPMSMPEAIRLGKVRGTLFGYAGSNNGSQYLPGTIMKPWFGYWFRNLSSQPLKLILHYPTSRAVATRKSQTRAQQEAVVVKVIESRSVNDYRIQIGTKMGNLVDTNNTIGVAPDAKDGYDNQYDTQKPPMLTAAPSIYIAIEGQNEQGRSAGFADMIRAATPGVKSWNFTVESTHDGEATLFWPNANRLPRGIEPLLVDLENGKRTAIRSASAYRFAARSRSVHRFRIEVSPAKTRPLAIVNARIASAGTRATAGTSYRVSFTSTQEADVQVEIQSFGGRVIRQLQTRAAASGETTVMWDGRNAQGAALPSGPYVVVLTARDETGATTRQMVPFVSVR